MDKRIPENYQLEDFITDDSFINYHFQLDIDDQVFWEEWLNEHPAYSALAERAQEMLQTLSLTLPDKEFQVELSKIKEAINYKQPLFSTSKPALVRFLNDKTIHRTSKNKKYRIAKYLIAAMLIFFAGSYFLYQYYTKDDQSLAVVFNHQTAPIVFTLNDSTVVTLAPQSALHYPRNFGDNERKVYLDGEAQFHVKRDVDHPFKVYSGEVVSTVLGTIFNVKQQGDSIVQVELLKGKLKVDKIDSSGVSLQSVILNPEERVVYNSHEKKLQKESWQSNNEHVASVNHLQFRQDNFETIAKELRSVFGVTVINQSSKKEWRFTGEFTNSTAKDIIENICIIKNLSYQVQADTIFIK